MISVNDNVVCISTYVESEQILDQIRMPVICQFYQQKGSTLPLINCVLGHFFQHGTYISIIVANQKHRNIIWKDIVFVSIYRMKHVNSDLYPLNVKATFEVVSYTFSEVHYLAVVTLFMCNCDGTSPRMHSLNTRSTGCIALFIPRLCGRMMPTCNHFRTNPDMN